MLIEPRLPLAVQTHWWTIGYALLMALFGLCAIAVWFAARRPAAAEEPILLTAAEEPARSADSSSLPESFHTPVTWLRRLWWLAQALVPSALLMGITTQLSVNISPRPMVWAIPLGLYLLSFIVVFARWPILKWLWLVRIFQAAGLAAAMSTVYLSSLDLSVMKTKVIVCVGALHLAAFFLTALVCHGAMAADRPASKHLTEYYLWMLAGGVAGGLICGAGGPAGLQQRAGVPADARGGMPAASAAAIEPLRTFLALVRPGTDDDARQRVRLCRRRPLA